MIYLWSVHLNGVRQTFSGQEHFQANITIITYFLKNMIDFYTASKSVFQALNIITILNIQDRTQRGDRGGGDCPLEKTIFAIFRMSLIILRIFGIFFGI